MFGFTCDLILENVPSCLCVASLFEARKNEERDACVPLHSAHKILFFWCLALGVRGSDESSERLSNMTQPATSHRKTRASFMLR